MQNLLNQLEDELKKLQLWDKEKPSEEALASVEPFCVDTLNFSQWLQWIYLPKMRILVAQGVTIPQSNILAIAEIALAGLENMENLFAIISALDKYGENNA